MGSCLRHAAAILRAVWPTNNTSSAGWKSEKAIWQRHSSFRGVSEASEPILTKTGRGLIAAPMIDTATILIARRRRTVAVWAEICV